MERIKSIGEIITWGARLYGRRTAYVHDGVTLTFRQLARSADCLSHRLRVSGVEHAEPVAVILDKSLNFIKALAAVLAVGAIYVPIDPKNPDDRIIYLLRDSGAKHVITTTASVTRLSALAAPAVIFICMDRSEEMILNKTVRTQRAMSVAGNDVAYIIYTSGSTQMPKGVAIRHDGLLNYIKETVAMYDFNAQTRILSVKSFSYDASLTDIFCPLYAGGRVYLHDETLVFPQVIEERIKRHGITHLSCTLPVFKLLAQKGSLRPLTYSKMKTMSVGGDVVSPEAFHKIKAELPKVRLFNRYGPTETTVACSTYEVTQQTDRNKPVPIGKPHKNVCFRAINEQGEGIGAGETGELFIGGVQVMAGYWRAPELTATVISEFEDGQRYYKTSDLVTLDVNGDYVFLRRLDNVVKKYGFRIGLNEVEAAIVSSGITDECVCIFISENDKCDSTRPKIVAYLRAEGNSKPDPQTREKLRLRLPNFMIPDVLIHLESIPKELSGKPARRLLKQKFLDGIRTVGHGC